MLFDELPWGSSSHYSVSPRTMTQHEKSNNTTLSKINAERFMSAIRIAIPELDRKLTIVSISPMYHVSSYSDTNPFQNEGHIDDAWVGKHVFIIAVDGDDYKLHLFAPRRKDSCAPLRVSSGSYYGITGKYRSVWKHGVNWRGVKTTLRFGCD